VRENPEVRDWHLTTSRTMWITACLVLVLVPHATNVPLWILGSFLLFALWRVSSAVLGIALPSRWLVVAITVALLAGVYSSYGTLFGRNAGVALLIVLAGMKLIESRSLRDAYVLSFLGYFLVVTNFLFSQSILIGLYMLVIVVGMTATLASFATDAHELGVTARLRLAGVVLLQATPVMLALFLLFPRLPGPLWGLPRDAHGGVSGLTDSMTPGNISRLTLSNDVAFRVKFRGKAPEKEQLYWRGPVLTLTDGRTWTRGQLARSWRSQYAELEGEPVDYVITMEPHSQRWLFALDVPSTIPPGAQMTQDFQLRTPKPVHQRIRYVMRSYPEYRLPQLSLEERTQALTLPERSHPKARAMALEWRESLGSDSEVVERALSYFRNQPFHYTLTPPLYVGDPVDEFLFDGRQGFCEHYAAAFTVLMRAAGIPTRIVTGYQGGEFNTVGDYMVVRQRDAHAWVEVWLGEKGWVRVDPTGAVSPNRIKLGMDGAIPPTIGGENLGILPTEPVEALWRRVRYGIDAINASWNEWVLGYGARKQRELLAVFGFDATGASGLSLGAIASVGLLLAVIGAWLSRRRPASSDPVVRSYRRFCRKLESAGLTRRANEGPLDFSRRVCIARPRLTGSVRRITDLYVTLRYSSADADSKELRREVAKLRVS